MESDITELALPPAPKGLCFDRLDFVKSNFSVDGFLADHQNVSSLETMRDDLGMYLKVLRLAMIELINKDYANFVNLSATLIGFDKSIEKIQLPLDQLYVEVENVKQCLEDAMKELSMWINERHSLHKKKQLLKHYSQTLKSLGTLDKVLCDLSEQNVLQKVVMVDRGAMQYNQLKYSVAKCETLLSSEHKKQFEQLGASLVQTLNELLFQFWNDNNEEKLLKILITLATLDKVEETETLVRKQAVAPLINELVSESLLQKNPNGLQGIYSDILLLLNTKLRLLFMVMQHSKLAFLYHKYNFIVNCFWPEVESRLELNLASIFAPGNPKIFYKRYNESMEFMRKLEEFCVNSDMVKLLRDTAQYKSFQKRWNLPVYFQIRFQEIAGSFEACLSDSPTVEPGGSFILKESSKCWSALQECWSDGVYIEALGHKFWKLTLQIILRYTSWITKCCTQRNQTSKLESMNTNKEIINSSINLYLDTQSLLQKLPSLLLDIESKIPIENKGLLRDSVKSTLQALYDTRDKILKCIVDELFDSFNIQLKQVSDIPRLYRKTNRSVPSKSCAYIDAISKSMDEFHTQSTRKLDNAFLGQLYEMLFNTMTTAYYKYVEDVITSVQKTEDSLRRLKQFREKTSPQTIEATGVSDGDKIRLQLNIDVVAYGNIARKLQVDVNKVNKLMDLSNMVTEAVKNINIK